MFVVVVVANNTLTAVRLTVCRPEETLATWHVLHQDYSRAVNTARSGGVLLTVQAKLFYCTYRPYMFMYVAIGYCIQWTTCMLYKGRLRFNCDSVYDSASL